MNRWRQVVLLAIPLLASASLVSGQTSRGTSILTGDYGNSWALLIGVDHTPGKATLSSVADARRMRDALVKIGFPAQNIRILPNPKGIDIRRVILRPFEGMAPNDRYVVYFSGHGDTRKFLDNEEEGYLLATDYDSGDLLNTAISMKEIRQFGRQMPVKHVLFILDACNAGHAVEQSGSDVPTAPDALKPYLERRVTEILAAGQAHQNAYQINNQGVFTKWIVKTIEFFPARKSGAALTTNLLWVDVSHQVSEESHGKLTPPQPYRSGQGAFVLWFPPPAAPQFTVRIAPDHGTLTIRGKLVGIEVWLDEQRVGATRLGSALVLEKVPTGKRRIKGTTPGHKDWLGEVEVVAGKQAEVMIDIEPLRSEPPKAIRTEDGAEMVLVPAGEFWMGSTRDEVDRVIAECRKLPGSTEAPCNDWYERELPRHRVMLDAFYIDQYEVTNLLFEKFVRARNYQTTAEREGSGRVSQQKDGKWQSLSVKDASWHAPHGPGTSAPSDHPVVQVSWHDAEKYCGWAGKRLPTEAEWEKAARGPDARRYPWGEDWDATRANGDMSVRATRPVGSYRSGTSLYDVHDMAGNVAEWVADWFETSYYQRSPARSPRGPDTGKNRVLRGGSGYNPPAYLRAADRYAYPPGYRFGNVGFRCARGAF